MPHREPSRIASPVTGDSLEASGPRPRVRHRPCRRQFRPGRSPSARSSPSPCRPSSRSTSRRRNLLQPGGGPGRLGRFPDRARHVPARLGVAPLARGAGAARGDNAHRRQRTRGVGLRRGALDALALGRGNHPACRAGDRDRGIDATRRPGQRRLSRFLRRPGRRRRAQRADRHRAGVRARLARRRLDRAHRASPAARSATCASRTTSAACCCGRSSRSSGCGEARRCGAGVAIAAGAAVRLRRRADALAHRRARRRGARGAGACSTGACRAARALAAVPGAADLRADAGAAPALWADAQPPRLRRRDALRPRATCLELALRDLVEHAGADRAHRGRRRLRRVQLRLDADAVPGPADRVLRPHAQPAAAASLVELGVPLAMLVLALLLYGAVAGARAARSATAAEPRHGAAPSARRLRDGAC